MLACTCRRKSKKSGDVLLLHGSGFAKAKAHTPKVTLTSLIRAALPAGTVMVGDGPHFVPSMLTFAANTSGPEPSLPAEDNPIAYASAADIWGNKATLFFQDALDFLPYDYSDVKQGKLHDCWLISALASLCRYGDKVIPQVFAGIDPPGSTAPSSVTVLLYNQDPNNFHQSGGVPVVQTVSWLIPVFTTNPTTPAFAHSDYDGEYWPCLLEKAVAAAATADRGNGVYQTGYDVVNGNRVCTGMSIFTPGLGAKYRLHTPPDPQALYAAWDSCLSTGVTIGLSWASDPNGLVMKNGMTGGSYGLLPNLSYLLMSLVSANGMQMALIRLPFGQNGPVKCNYKVQTNQQGEWNGPWSDCSPEWDTPLGQAMKVVTGYTGPRSDGLFWMDMNDVAQYLAIYDIFIPARQDLRQVDLRLSPFLRMCLPTQVPKSNYSAKGSLAGIEGTTVNIQCKPGYSGGGPATCHGGQFNVTPCV